MPLSKIRLKDRDAITRTALRLFLPILAIAREAMDTLADFFSFFLYCIVST